MSNAVTPPIRVGRSKERGLLLFIVSIVISILALGGVALLGLMRIEREATAERLAEIQLNNADRSAVTLIQTLAESDPKERASLGGLYDNPKLFRGVGLLFQEDGARADVRFTILAPIFNRDSIEGIRYGLVDESTRLNLSAVLEWDEAVPGTGRAALMKLPGMTPVMADSILDWIDDDERPRPQGAESGFYAQKKLPYSPRNAVPVFLEELLLVRDVTRYQLYGTDENFNFGGIANRPQNVSATGGDGTDSDGGFGSLSAPPVRTTTGGVDSLRPSAPAFVPWSQLLTVFSAERDTDPAGNARIDLNGSDLSFLFDELRSYVNEQVAAFVVLYRQYGPAPPEMAAGTGQKATAERIDFALSAAFQLETPLDIVGAKVFVPSENDPQKGTLYVSPFADERRTVTGLFDYLDYVSTARSTVITGRVNVNAAPRPVLEAVPDLPASAVQRILNSRPAPNVSTPAEYRHAAWLYSDGIVDLATMKKLWNKLTTQGGVWRSQIVGYLDAQSVLRRAEVVVDGTVSPARQVFYKDLSMYGPGFAPATITGDGKTADPNRVIGSLIDRETRSASPFFDAESSPIPSDPFDALGSAGFAPPDAQGPDPFSGTISDSFSGTLSEPAFAPSSAPDQ